MRNCDSELMKKVISPNQHTIALPHSRITILSLLYVR